MIRFFHSWLQCKTRQIIHTISNSRNVARQLFHRRVNFPTRYHFLPLFLASQPFFETILSILDEIKQKTRSSRKDYVPAVERSLSPLHKMSDDFHSPSLWGIASRKLFIVVRTRLFVRIDIKDRQKAVQCLSRTSVWRVGRDYRSILNVINDIIHCWNIYENWL